jgi:flagellar basal-body rod protein FlgB
MGISDLPIFSALKSKMSWHQTRQKLLAENVANAETPGYGGRDLAQYNFEAMVSRSSVKSVSTMTTHAGHIRIGNSGNSGFGARDMNSFEITPEGNGVVLEDEMMKVAANQMDYQAATSLYTRSLQLIRTALGRS